MPERRHHYSRYQTNWIKWWYLSFIYNKLYQSMWCTAIRCDLRTFQESHMTSVFPDIFYVFGMSETYIPLFSVVALQTRVVNYVWNVPDRFTAQKKREGDKKRTVWSSQSVFLIWLDFRSKQSASCVFLSWAHPRLRHPSYFRIYIKQQTIVHVELFWFNVFLLRVASSISHEERCFWANANACRITLSWA